MLSDIKMVKQLVLVAPSRLMLCVFFLLFAGFAEGIGILSLLPILTLVDGKSADPSELASVVDGLIASVGLEPRLGPLLLILVFGIVLKACLILLAQRVVGYAAADYAMELRARLLDAMSRASWRYFVGQKTGHLSNALTTETTQTSAAYSALVNLIAVIIQSAVFVSIAIMTSWEITLASMTGGLFIVLVLQWAVDRARQAGIRQAAVMKSLMAKFADNLQLVRPLKAMGQERRLSNAVSSDSERINSSQRDMLIAMSTLSVFQEPVFTVILALGMYFALEAGGFAVTELLFFGILFHRIVGRVGQVQIQYQKLASQEPYFSSLHNLLEETENAREKGSGNIKEYSITEGIVFDSVCFGYSSDQPVLDDVNLFIPARSLTVFHGPSGVGKSTAVDLLLGFIVPDNGRILVDNQDIRSLDISVWRGSIGYVPQELVLLHDTIAMNISLGDQEISDQDIRDALERADAIEFVDALPDGIKTSVGEKGTRFSGGQRQRLSLARALVRKPHLLVLDEPTSALDKNSTAKLNKAILDISQDVTTIVVSHQADLVNQADHSYDFGQFKK